MISIIIILFEKHVNNVFRRGNLLKRFINFIACTVKGFQGNGMERGSCEEDHRCFPNGNCKKDCLVRGQPGDGTQRGDCDEGLLCQTEGRCREPSKFGITNNITFHKQAII